MKILAAAKKGKGVGNFHPLAWYQEYDGGIYWAATGNGFTAN